MKTTITAAAVFLSVSKPYLKKLIDKGALSLDVENLIAYKDRRNAERRLCLDEMSAMCQELGFYDE